MASLTSENNNLDSYDDIAESMYVKISNLEQNYFGCQTHIINMLEMIKQKELNNIELYSQARDYVNINK